MSWLEAVVSWISGLFKKKPKYLCPFNDGQSFPNFNQWSNHLKVHNGQLLQKTIQWK